MKDLGLRDNGVTMAEYTSLLFVGERAVITYDVYGTGSLGHALNLRVLPLKWFYKKTPSDSLLEKQGVYLALCFKSTAFLGFQKRVRGRFVWLKKPHTRQTTCEG